MITERIVLEVDYSNSKVLLVSKMILDAQPYDAKGRASTFDSSSLYTWLQNDFMKYAFSNLE